MFSSMFLAGNCCMDALASGIRVGTCNQPVIHWGEGCQFRAWGWLLMCHASMLSMFCLSMKHLSGSRWGRASRCAGWPGGCFLTKSYLTVEVGCCRSVITSWWRGLWYIRYYLCEHLCNSALVSINHQVLMSPFHNNMNSYCKQAA